MMITTALSLMLCYYSFVFRLHTWSGFRTPTVQLVRRVWWIPLSSPGPTSLFRWPARTWWIRPAHNLRYTKTFPSHKLCDFFLLHVSCVVPRVFTKVFSVTWHARNPPGVISPCSLCIQVLSAATIVAKHTSALCNACRLASSKTPNPVAKRQFVQSAKEVANTTANLVKSIKVRFSAVINPAMKHKIQVMSDWPTTGVLTFGLD